MLALSDPAARPVVRTAAYQLPRSLRSVFLQRLAVQLNGREFGDGELHRVPAHHRARGILLSLDDMWQLRNKPKNYF